MGFVPQQDQGYLIVACQLPDAASLERTQAVTAKALALIKETPGVTTSLVIDGFSMLSGSNQSNVGSIIVILDGFDKRKSPALSANAILQNLRAKFNQIPEALVFAFGPPPIQGVGSTGGFRMMVQDRRGGDYKQLQAVTQSLIEAGETATGSGRTLFQFPRRYT